MSLMKNTEYLKIVIARTGKAIGNVLFRRE